MTPDDASPATHPIRLLSGTLYEFLFIDILAKRLEMVDRPWYLRSC